MKGWIEVHTFTDNELILVNLANVTSIIGNWIFLVKENNVEDDEEEENNVSCGNIHTREDYFQLRALVRMAQ